MITRIATWKNLCGLSLALPMALAAMGCAIAPADGSEPKAEAIGTAEAAYSGYWNYTWNVSSASSLDLGVDTGKSCFLAGITGNLTSYAGLETVTQGTFVNVDIRNGHYFLDISPSADGVSVAGQMIGATVICLPTIGHRTTPVTHAGWSSSTAPTLIAPATAGRRCFLTGVENVSDFSDAHQAFGESTDSLQVFQSSGNWYLGGTGIAAGSAGCVDVDGSNSGWEYIAPTKGTITEKMAAASGGVQCLLTGIGGDFQADSWSDGVTITEQESLLQWNMTVSNGKTGWSNCVY
jgi:hypothetical protein